MILNIHLFNSIFNDRIKIRPKHYFLFYKLNCYLHHSLMNIGHQSLVLCLVISVIMNEKNDRCCTFKLLASNHNKYSIMHHFAETKYSLHCFSIRLPLSVQAKSQDTLLRSIFVLKSTSSSLIN